MISELIIVAVIILSFLAICAPMALHRRKLSEVAEEKWETEDTTVYVRYGNYDIPMLQSQVATWEQMHPNEKFGLLEHLKAEVKGKRLTVEKENGITKFTGITSKAKDIQHRQKQRTEAWNTSQ